MIQYPLGNNAMCSIGEDKYVGTLMRYHYDYHRALLLVGIFNLDKWLFNHVFEIEKKKAKMEKNSKQCLDIQIFLH